MREGSAQAGCRHVFRSKVQRGHKQANEDRLVRVGGWLWRLMRRAVVDHTRYGRIGYEGGTNKTWTLLSPCCCAGMNAEGMNVGIKIASSTSTGREDNGRWSG